MAAKILAINGFYVNKENEWIRMGDNTRLLSFDNGEGGLVPWFENTGLI